MPAPVETPLAVARDHPAFAGHFPGHPVLPAAVLLAEVLAAIEAATARPVPQWEIASAKFPRAAEPGAALTLAHEADDGGGIRFEVRGPAGVVASGTLAPRAAP